MQFKVLRACSFQIHTGMEIINALVLRYFNYIVVLLSDRPLSIFSKEELKWAVKLSLNSKIYDTSHDL